MVGVEAMTVKHLKEPTMKLNLKGHSPELQESIVLLEFGRALGLEHEHQRSEFWDVLEKHLNVEEMKKDPRVGAFYEKNWARAPATSDGQSVNSLSEYDPDSIMHYQ